MCSSVALKIIDSWPKLEAFLKRIDFSRTCFVRALPGSKWRKNAVFMPLRADDFFGRNTMRHPQLKILPFQL
jgi:hypothetical protein